MMNVNQLVIKCIFEPTQRLGVTSYHTCFKSFGYVKKDESVNDRELEILNKTNVPNNNDEQVVYVTDATDTKKVSAANTFTSTSIFFDETVSKFVNCMMFGGKKTVSEKVLRDTFEKIKLVQLKKYHNAENKSEIELNPLNIFHKAMENVKPVLGTQTMKKKGKNFQVPYPLPENRRRFLAIKWFLDASRNRPGNSTAMSDKLSREMLDAYNNEGTVMQKKVDFHKKAEVNRAFAHYRWW